MDLSVDQKKKLEKVAGGLNMPTGTFNNLSTFANKSFKSVDKMMNVGGKITKPGAITKIKPSNPVSAVTTQKGLSEATKGLGKISSEHGDFMNTNTIKNAYIEGTQDAFEKIAMPFPGQDPAAMQQPMQQDPAAMQQMDPAAMQQQQAPEAAAPMVGAQMGDVQQNMAAQASPEELQDIQNSGITSGDIASAAKVIQTMAEMKATADMAGIAPIDQSGAQAHGAPAPQG